MWQAHFLSAMLSNCSLFFYYQCHSFTTTSSLCKRRQRMNVALRVPMKSCFLPKFGLSPTMLASKCSPLRTTLNPCAIFYMVQRRPRTLLSIKLWYLMGDFTPYTPVFFINMCVREPKHIPVSLHDLKVFDFYVCHSRKRVQVCSSASDAHCRRIVVEDAPVADVSERGTCNGVEQHPNVEKVDAVPIDEPTESYVTFTERAYLPDPFFSWTALRLSTWLHVRPSWWCHARGYHCSKIQSWKPYHRWHCGAPWPDHRDAAPVPCSEPETRKRSLPKRAYGLVNLYKTFIRDWAWLEHFGLTSMLRLKTNSPDTKLFRSFWKQIIWSSGWAAVFKWYL